MKDGIVRIINGISSLIGELVDRQYNNAFQFGFCKTPAAINHGLSLFCRSPDIGEL